MLLPTHTEDRFIVTDPEAIAMLKSLVPAKLGPGKRRQRQQELANLYARFALGLDGDMTITQAARHLNAHPNSIRNYVRDGRFPGYYYRSPRKIAIPFKDVMSYPDRYRVRITNDDRSRIKPRTNAFSDDPLPRVKLSKAVAIERPAPAPRTRTQPRRQYLTRARKLALAEQRAAVTTVGVSSQQVVPQTPAPQAIEHSNDTPAVPLPQLEAGQ